jgi:penicillin-binding protein 1A
MRLSLWLEREMQAHYGSKRRAKEEILARYVSFVYMGKGQYGFATAAEYYFGRPLTTFDREDADKAAVLAGITKSPRDYAPTARNRAAVLRRRNQTLDLMVANGALSPEDAKRARSQALGAVPPEAGLALQAPSVVGHVLEELTSLDPDLGVEDLLQGRIQGARQSTPASSASWMPLWSTAWRAYGRRDIKTAAAGSGLGYRAAQPRRTDPGRNRRPPGLRGREAAYSDYNRVTQSRRQPGSAMKPIVYLAAFSDGALDLDTVVPDEPISVSNGLGRPRKWIFELRRPLQGIDSVRIALAESRNAVAIWIVEQIGIDRVLRTAKSLDVRTPLARFPTTALGASEMSLIDLANAYRTMASGIAAEPHVIRSVVRNSGEAIAIRRRRNALAPFEASALALIQEGLRGVVRLPSGTAHALAAVGFPIAVMEDRHDQRVPGRGVRGLDLRPDGMTAAVGSASTTTAAGSTRDWRAIGLTSLRGADACDLPGPARRGCPAFPARMEQRITDFLRGP